LAPTLRAPDVRDDGLGENPPDLAEQPSFVQDFAQIWQAADKIV
jgi:hypothetical protein